MTGRFAGRRALVTGGAGGLGRAMVGRFLAEGASVAIADLRAEAIEAARQALGEDCLAVVMDLRDGASIGAGLDQAWQALGGLDILVNNAGIFPGQPILEISEGDWDRVLDTNLKGAFLLSQGFAQRLVAAGRPGCIVNISSGSAQRARFGTAHYSASKAGLEMLTRCFALELGQQRIRVNAVSPSFIETRSEVSPISPDFAKATQATRPWPRAGTPADIAQAVAYLCSDEAEWITGTTLRVDGGRSAGDFHLPISGG